ncbi:uncharacterized protein LOC128239954 isoform X2 [Mya arenaria]|uniref:uncharacterized protein LOC128239954 isoform X2 n=1 Tax=Mya arenaria TaxID=6604 RepID=UPI0022E7D30D|nr:uncharacterized protein LOC128239954 isoform X2 [Mya arenaria]
MGKLILVLFLVIFATVEVDGETSNQTAEVEPEEGRESSRPNTCEAKSLIKEFDSKVKSYCRTFRRSEGTQFYKDCMKRWKTKYETQCKKCRQKQKRCKALKKLHRRLRNTQRPSPRNLAVQKTDSRWLEHCIVKEQLKNLDTEICCDDHIEKRRFGKSSICCGKTQFNGKLRICCNGTVAWLDKIPRKAAACCGQNPINMKTTACYKDSEPDAKQNDSDKAPLMIHTEEQNDTNRVKIQWSLIGSGVTVIVFFIGIVMYCICRKTHVWPCIDIGKTPITTPGGKLNATNGKRNKTCSNKQREVTRELIGARYAAFNRETEHKMLLSKEANTTRNESCNAFLGISQNRDFLCNNMFANSDTNPSPDDWNETAVKTVHEFPVRPTDIIGESADNQSVTGQT